MSDDWQPGDLALVVEMRSDHPVVRPGTVWRVNGVFTSSLGRRALVLEGAQPRNGGKGFLAAAFRKIRPHTPDVEDAETIALLKGGRVPA